jgi:hypothetical protein
MTIPEVASVLGINKNLDCSNTTAFSSSLAAATAFLKQVLTDGPLDASTIWKAAREQGLSVITVKRAKIKAGVITRRMGTTGKRGGGKYIWELPGHKAMGVLPVKDDLGDQGDPINENDTLNVVSTPDPILPIDRREAILGMPVARAIEIWRSKRSPVFALRQDEYCRDMARLLSNPDCSENHLKAVRAWLDKL